MFVLTTRLRKKRAILVGVLAILLIAGGLLWRGLSREAEAPEETVLRDNEDRIAYLKELGWWTRSPSKAWNWNCRRS